MQGFTKEQPLDTDPNLTANSDYIAPSQSAVKTALAAYLKLDASNGPVTGPLVFDPSTDTLNIKIIKETGDVQKAFALFMGANPNPVAYIDPNGNCLFANLSGTNTGDASITSTGGTIMPISSGQNIDLSVVPSAIAHNDLGSKQGGTAGEYYHLTSAQATVVGNTSGVNTGDQDLSIYLKLDGSNDPITGDLKLIPAADSTSVFQVFKSGGTTNVFNVDTTNSRIGILTATPSYTLSFASESARTVQVERRTSANVAGNALIIQAGGATALATDKAGGILQLNGGLSTGTGTSQILLRTYTPGTTGTADNVLATRATINNSGLAVSGVLSVTSTAATTGTVLTIGGTTPVDDGTVLDMIATLSGTGSLLGLNIRPNYSNVGTGATIMGAAFGPNINSPTGTVATMYGMLFIPRLNTDSSVVVSNVYGMYVRLDNVSTATPVSTVARYEGIHLAVPYQNLPTVSYSIVIDDLAGDLVLGDGNDIILGSTTGTKIGITTTEKLGFFGSTPVVQQVAATDLGTVLSNLGLRAAGTAYPITTSGAVQFTGGVTISTTNLTITDKDIVLSATTGTKIGTATTQKLGFFNATPVVRGTAFDQTNYSAASHTHAAVTQLAAPAGGTGTAAGGWDTAANRNLAITSINAARTDIANVKQVLNALIDELQALGLIA